MKVVNKFPSASVTKVAQAPIYSELLFETSKSLTGSDSIRQVNDVYLLFNQQRLDKQTQEVLIDNIRHAVGDSGLSDLRNKFTDEQLCQQVKSRYIQSQSELHDYMRYLMWQEKNDRIESEYKKKLDDDLKSNNKDEPKNE